MLTLWWDVKGIVVYELLPRNQTKYYAYCRHLDKLNNSVKQKRPQRVITTTLPFTVITQNLTQVWVAVLRLCWDLLPHPPDRLTFIPVVAKRVNGDTFNSNENIKSFLELFYFSESGQ